MRSNVARITIDLAAQLYVSRWIATWKTDPKVMRYAASECIKDGSLVGRRRCFFCRMRF